MAPFYIMRYGFYEDLTSYRADPDALGRHSAWKITAKAERRRSLHHPDLVSGGKFQTAHANDGENPRQHRNYRLG